jgi:hypothetical protein
MYNFSYFKCRFQTCELGIGGTPSLQGKGALVDILNADSQENRFFIFAQTPKQLLYYHEYAMPPQNDMFVMRAANNRVREFAGDQFEVITQADHPYVYVVIDANPDEPLVAIENCKICKRAKDEVRMVLEYSFSRDLGTVGWKVKLEPYEPKLEETSRITRLMAKINDPQDSERSLERMYGIKKTDFLIRNCLRSKAKRSAKRKSDEMRDYVLFSDKELVIELLDEELKKLRGAKNISRPVRFLQDHVVIDRATYEAFIKCYPYMKNRISPSRYNDYTNPEKKDHYKNDNLYYKYQETFSAILKDITE